MFSQKRLFTIFCLLTISCYIFSSNDWHDRVNLHNPNQILNPMTWDTALHLAIREENQILTAELLSTPGIQVNQVNQDTETALHEAITTQNPEMVAMLLAAGANVYAVNYLDQNALQLAEEYTNRAERDPRISSRSADRAIEIQEMIENAL